jgi:hypothetical protein
MQSNAMVLIAVICGFFLIMLGMVAFVVYASRKENEKYTRIAQALGFAPLENADEVLRKVAFLRDLRMDGHHRLTHVYCRAHASGARTCMYNLSFRTRSRSESGSGRKATYHPLEMNALAFISPACDLPRFNALPRLSGSGAMAKLGNSIAEKTMDIKHEVIKFQHIPNLDQRYLISTSEPLPANVRPPDGFLRVLAAHPNLNVYAGGDTLTLSFVGDNAGLPDVERMKQLYKIGVELAREVAKPSV